MHKHISFKFQYCCKIKLDFQNREPTCETSSTHKIQHEPFTKTLSFQLLQAQQQQEGTPDHQFQVFPVLTTHHVSHKFGLICGLFWPVSASWVQGWVSLPVATATAGFQSADSGSFTALTQPWCSQFSSLCSVPFTPALSLHSGWLLHCVISYSLSLVCLGFLFQGCFGVVFFFVILFRQQTGLTGKGQQQV